jgi:hypothetical protein
MQYGRRARKWTPSAILVLTYLTVASAAVSAEEIYSATLTASKGLGQKKTATLTVTITERTTESDAETLRTAYAEGGSQGFFDAVRKFDLGLARVTGGSSSTIRFVRAYPGQNGSRVLILTDGPLYFPEDTPDITPRDSIGVISLEVTSSGRGRGTLAEALKLRVTREGTFEVEASRTAPIELESVERVQ